MEVYGTWNSERYAVISYVMVVEGISRGYRGIGCRLWFDCM